MHLSSAYLLTVASSLHLLRSQATVEMPSPSDTPSVRSASSDRSLPHAGPMPWVGRSKVHAWQGIVPGGRAGSGEFSCTRSQRAQAGSPTAHSKIHPGILLFLSPWEHQAMPLLNPSACSSLNVNQAQFSVQAQAKSAGNIFSFGGPDRNRKPLLCLGVSSQWLQVFSSKLKAISEFHNSSLEAWREGRPCLETWVEKTRPFQAVLCFLRNPNPWRGDFFF